MFNKAKKKNKNYKTFSPILLITILLTTLIISTTQTYATQDLSNYQTIKLELKKNINITFQTNKTKNIQINSKYNPNNFEQINQIKQIKSNHNYNYNKKENNYNYEFNNYKKNKLNIKINFEIENQINYPKITKFAKYEIKNTNYTQFSNLINTNKKIKEKASQIANYQNDTYIIATKIANWISKNIKYDLSITQNSQTQNNNASWIFKNKKGVCKEFTTLYISMLRSLGIESRIVIGYAYTNEEKFNLNWAGHAWAEVLINKKWIPFDITYNQYGFVDATHIPFFKITNFSQILNDRLKTNTNSKTFTNNFQVNIIDKKPIQNDNNIKINYTVDKKLGFGSKNFLKLNIKNNKNYYQILQLKTPKYLSKILEFQEKEKTIILKPQEEKTIIFNFQIENPKEKNYIYQFPIIIHNYENLIVNTTIQIQKNYKTTNKQYKENSTTKKNQTNTNKIKINCNSFQTNLNYIYNCSFQNLNHNIIKNYNICFNSHCIQEDFLINEKKNLFHKSFKNKLNLTYGSDNKSTIYHGKKPDLILHLQNKQKNQLYIQYLIINQETTPNKLYIQIYNNEKLILVSQKTQLNQTIKLNEKQIKTHKNQSNNIKIILRDKNQIFQTKEYTYTTKTKTNIIKKIWDNILKLFI